MREIKFHRMSPFNRKIRVFAVDEPVDGQNYEYVASIGDRELISIRFQKGKPRDGINGITHEVLSTILIDRVKQYETGETACLENKKILKHLKKSMTWANIRIKRVMRERNAER